MTILLSWVRDNRLLSLALVATLAILLAHASVYGFVTDDAYISFRYARNMIEGLGLVFNAGERVEGMTNLLWTLWSALGLRLGVDAPRWALAWGGICFAASILLLGFNHLQLRRAATVGALTVPVEAQRSDIGFTLEADAGAYLGYLGTAAVAGVLTIDDEALYGNLELSGISFTGFLANIWTLLL